MIEENEQTRGVLIRQESSLFPSVSGGGVSAGLLLRSWERSADGHNRTEREHLLVLREHICLSNEPTVISLFDKSNNGSFFPSLRPRQTQQW